MHYDITKLSDNEAQLVGKHLEARLTRLNTLIDRNEADLEYQQGYGTKGFNGLNGILDAGKKSSWDEAIVETQKRLGNLRGQRSEVQTLLEAMTVN